MLEVGYLGKFSECDRVLKNVCGRIILLYCYNTLEEVKTLIQEAIEFHLESLQEYGEEIPLPNSSIEYVEAKISA